MGTGLTKKTSRLVFAALALVNSIWIFSIYLSVTYMGQFQPASLSSVLEGTAGRPYAYRVLLPLIARIMAPLIPPALVQSFDNSSTPLGKVFDQFSNGQYPREAAVVLSLMFLCLLLFPFAARTFLADLEFPGTYGYFLALVMQLLILPVNLFAGFYYDLPQLLLVTLSLLFLHRANWVLYLLLLTIASVNKETAVFLVAVYALYYWRRLPRIQFVKLLLLQLALYGFVRLLTYYYFRGNPGSSIFWTVPDQIEKYVKYPAAFLFTLLYIGVVTYFVQKRWRDKHDFLRASAVLPGIILVLFFTSGFPMEFRVFLEALPILAALVFYPASLPATKSSEVS